MATNHPAQSEIQELRAATAAVGRLQKTCQRLAEQHTAATRERQKLFNVPPPRAELIANMEAHVDRYAERFTTDNARGLASSLGGGRKLREDGRLNAVPPKLPDWFTSADGLTFPMLCGLARELVKASLRHVLETGDFETGPPSAERAALIAECDARIQQLEAMHTAIVDEAAALDPPITIALLPAVKKRREDEARAAEREAERQALREPLAASRPA